jgi:ketosteroid isomerase-like protein
MRGIVIHHQRGVARALWGRAGGGRLSVRAVLTVPPARGEVCTRPVTYVFYEGERVIASSPRVLLMRGRRYSEVEHWFVLPETECPLTAPKPLLATAAP